MKRNVDSLRPTSRLGAFIGVMAAAKPFRLPPVAILYVFVLVFVTDGLIWNAAQSIGAYSARDMLLYSLAAWPLWIFVGVKGLAKEQTDLFESGRWTALDLLPGGPTLLICGHSLAKTFRSMPVRLYAAGYAGVHLYLGGSLGTLLAIAPLVFLGTANLTLAGILCRYLAPRGYSSIVAAIVHNTTYLVSGSVFPLGMITDSLASKLFNPFAAAVAIPAERILALGKAGVLGAGSMEWSLLAAGLWTVMLLAACILTEGWRRAALHS